MNRLEDACETLLRLLIALVIAGTVAFALLEGVWPLLSSLAEVLQL